MRCVITNQSVTSNDLVTRTLRWAPSFRLVLAHQTCTLSYYINRKHRIRVRIVRWTLTITALLASLAVDLQAGLVVALTHTLFNLAAIVLIYPVRRVRYIPVGLAERLAELAVSHRPIVLVYVAGMFVIAPIVAIGIFG